MAPALTCDTSVVIAGLSSWHQHHATARAVLPTIDWLAAHVLAETVSVLSRLPGGRGVPLSDAVSLVRRLADGRVRQLPPDRYLLVLGAAGSAGLGGGAVYDALIGATAREHNATLVSLDRRAQRAYAAVGANVQVVD
ncbi:MAG: VapC toxin family PIN domain ribonuclease [Pseudonocardiales bacterium]|nr:MAG: VapC toxin family PIN domain ribonuclease [Pseudonocardiales bacterium]